MILISAFFDGDLDAILGDSAFSGCVVSACVRRLDETVVFERNSALRVVPASNQKLLSAAFALNELGPDWRATTSVWKLHGRLVLETSGDPMATWNQWRSVGKQLGIRGPLPILVKQPYANVVPPGWELDDLPNKYAARVSAFTVDRGAVELWSTAKGPEFRPPSPGLRWIRRPASKLKVKCDPMTGVATIEGPLPPKDTRLDTLALPNPSLAAAAAIGGRLEASVRVPLTQPTEVIRGTSLMDIVKECLVNSDNQLAEHLLLLAAGRSGELGQEPYDRAGPAMLTFLTSKVGVQATDFQPVDGSGLSRHNLVTTRGLSKLLCWSLKAAWSPGWLSWLATPGQGTLKSRLPNSSFVGKTGTLDGVVALSGYVTIKSGERVALSLIVNGALANSTETRKTVDRFVSALEDRSGFGTENE